MTGEFRFQCPACGQHIQAEARDAGTQVKCPTCQADIVVPDPAAVPKLTVAKGRFSVPVPLHAQAAPRASGLPPPPPPPPPPMCRRAVVSLVLALASVILWPFGFIPAIILGRAATLEIKKDPTLRGLELAKAGLAIGYAFAGLFAAAAVVALALWGFPVAGKFFHAQKPAPVAKPAQPPVATSTVPASPPATMVTDTNWTLELGRATMPDTPAKGRVHGREFKLQRCTIRNGSLSLRQGDSWPPDVGVSILLPPRPAEDYSKKTFLITANLTANVPRVILRWKDDQKLAATENIDRGYALKLEFGQVAGGQLPGKLYLCTPDEWKSFVLGSFKAEIRKPGPPKPRPPPPTPPR